MSMLTVVRTQVKPISVEYYEVVLQFVVTAFAQVLLTGQTKEKKRNTFQQGD